MTYYQRVSFDDGDTVREITLSGNTPAQIDLVTAKYLDDGWAILPPFTRRQRFRRWLTRPYLSPVDCGIVLALGAVIAEVIR